MPAVTNFPMRLVAELLTMPTTDRSCSVPSPQSSVSDPVAGLVANGMRFCARALHALVSCSSGWRRDREFDRWRFPEVRLAVAPVCGDFGMSAIPPVFSLLSLGHSFGAFPAPGGNCAALLHKLRRIVFQKRKDGCAAACALRVSVSRKSFVQRTQKTFSRPSEKAPLALGSGAPHVASRKSVPRKFRAKPTWRKSSWHFTKTPSA
jgi:hypothetical protein